MAEYVVELVERPAEERFLILARRERVVRCIDCKHAHPCPLAGSEKMMCELMDEMFVDPCDFCAWGEESEY